ncbi:MAG: hypothetical protein IJQ25_07260 [Oscillibacter sp.]|nr:hypothetical protein [Oscillibacter sp.]
MAPIAQRIAQMVDILPDADQELALTMVEKLVLAWDPDFTKVTPSEEAAIEQAIRELDAGEYVTQDEIDWN